MAKELAMVERNEKGKQARRYFINCEKKLIESKQLSKPNKQQFLLTIDPDGGSSSIPIADYALVKRKDLIAIHRSFSNLQAAITQSAKAWNSIAENTGMDALKI